MSKKQIFNKKYQAKLKGGGEAYITAISEKYCPFLEKFWPYLSGYSYREGEDEFPVPLEWTLDGKSLSGGASLDGFSAKDVFEFKLLHDTAKWVKRWIFEHEKPEEGVTVTNNGVLKGRYYKNQWRSGANETSYP